MKLFDALYHPTQGSLSNVSPQRISAVMLGGFNAETTEQHQHINHPSIDVYRSAGIHPWAVGEDINAQLQALDEALNAKPLSAVGEIGLDRHHQNAPIACQQRVFSAQLHRAQHHGLPVILHVVSAHGMALDMLTDTPGMVHGFSGAPQLAHAYMQRGLYISFGRMLLNSNARKARASASTVPLNRLLIESDGPHSALGTDGLCAVLEALSNLRPESRKELAQATANNARTLFGPPLTQPRGPSTSTAST